TPGGSPRASSAKSRTATRCRQYPRPRHRARLMPRGHSSGPRSPTSDKAASSTQIAPSGRRKVAKGEREASGRPEAEAPRRASSTATATRAAAQQNRSEGRRFCPQPGPRVGGLAQPYGDFAQRAALEPDRLVVLERL